MKSKKSLKAAIYYGVLCLIIVCVSVVLPITLAKYVDKLEGYVDFEVGSFNAAILTPTVGESAEPIKITYYDYDFQPGMRSRTIAALEDSTLTAEALENIDDNAAVTKFTVQNGNTAEDAASTPLQYTIRLRISNSLPLKYTLKMTKPATEEGGMAQTYYLPLLKDEAHTTLIEEENADKRFEYQFSSVPLGQTEPLITGENSDEILEMTFYLDQGTADNPLVSHDYELIAEWLPEYSQSKYMKEVEIVEIMVTVISLNKSEDPDYQMPSNPVTDPYAEGLILLSSGAVGTTKNFDYEIDLRSFESSTVGNPGQFTLNVDNTYGLGLDQATAPYSAKYTMQVMVPLDIIEVEQGETAWSFTVIRSDLVYKGTDGTILTPPNLLTHLTGYRVYNLKTGTHTFYANRADVPSISDEEKVYAVYQLDIQELVYQKQNTTGGYEITSNTNVFVFQSNQSIEKTDEQAFLNKIKITISATFYNAPAHTD